MAVEDLGAAKSYCIFERVSRCQPIRLATDLMAIRLCSVSSIAGQLIKSQAINLLLLLNI